MLVSGAIPQPLALAAPSSMIVANTVAVLPTSTERLSGNTAAVKCGIDDGAWAVTGSLIARNAARPSSAISHSLATK